MMDIHRKTMLLFISLAIVMTAWPTGVRAICCCPTFWTAFGQHCYRFFASNTTWQDAENHCQTYSVPSLGSGGAVIDSLGHLVSIHSEAEHNFVATLFETSRKKESGMANVWLGMHDTSTEGHFQWTDGTPFDFTMWSPGQPDNWRSQEDCGLIRSTYGNKWNDAPCDFNGSSYFVCKLPAL
eukprot:XP_003730280.1 PREDICTED: echinoidin isoform X2 [Strongylocentrotus purpuratus]